MNAKMALTIVMYRPQSARTHLEASGANANKVMSNLIQHASVSWILSVGIYSSYSRINISLAFYCPLIARFVIADVDECMNGTHDCNATSEFCNNTIGSYTCECKEGFEPDCNGCKGVSLVGAERFLVWSNGPLA